MAKPTIWTDDRDDELVRLRGDGWSWQVIAEEMGLTKAAVKQRFYFFGRQHEPLVKARRGTGSLLVELEAEVNPKARGRILSVIESRGYDVTIASDGHVTIVSHWPDSKPSKRRSSLLEGAIL